MKRLSVIAKLNTDVQRSMRLLNLFCHCKEDWMGRKEEGRRNYGQRAKQNQGKILVHKVMNSERRKNKRN
jgi:hypothetical protein